MAPAAALLSVTRVCGGTGVQYVEPGMIPLPVAGVNGSLRFPRRSPGTQLVRIWVYVLCSGWTSVETDLQGLRVFCFLVFSFVCVFILFLPGQVMHWST